MTVQSSFLIRCTLNPPGNSAGDPTPARPYYIRHVQTGAEFRSATLAEVTRWVADQNLRYLSDMIAAPPDPNSGAAEDLQ
jgi:hypothetical protein